MQSGPVWSPRRSVICELPLRAAWERAQEAGAYRFTADAEQTLTPRPLPSMTERMDERVDMRIEGEVISPDRARQQLHSRGGAGAAPSICAADCAMHSRPSPSWTCQWSRIGTWVRSSRTPSTAG